MPTDQQTDMGVHREVVTLPISTDIWVEKLPHRPLFEVQLPYEPTVNMSFLNFLKRQENYTCMLLSEHT